MRISDWSSDVCSSDLMVDSALTLIPRGARYSSRRISPGWIGRMPFLDIRNSISVVIDDLDVPRPIFIPDKADAPLIINADAVLPGSISLECFQSVAWRRPDRKSVG